MSICTAEKNTVMFTEQGTMHCGLLLQNKYNLIVIKHFEYNNKKIFNKICNQIIGLYSKNLLDKEKLVLRIECLNSSRINEFKPLYELLNNNGFKQVEFVNNNIHYSPILENMLKEDKASLCLKMNYGEKFDEMSLRNLRAYLEQAKNKEDINVHCIINEADKVNDKGIQDFIKLMYKTGINKIGLRLNSKYLNSDYKYNFPDNFSELFVHFFKTAKRYSFFIDVKNKEQNEFLRKLCKTKKRKKPVLKNKIKKCIFCCGG